jgi:AraC-like DNA-binding protein
MHIPARIRPISLTPARNLLTDVEHRSIYTLARCELNVFETYRPADMFALTFNDAVITSMVRGKKVMHLPGMAQFDYFPGETVLAPAGTRMEIDFPEAEAANPTQCIALTLDSDSVGEAIHYLNRQAPRNSSGWHFNYEQLHLKNSANLASVISKLVDICKESSLTKDALADLTLKELIIRLVQLQALDNAGTDILGTGALNAVVQYIRKNLSSRLEIDALSRFACMSRPSFFRLFRREYGISPTQFIIRERIAKARRLLADTNETVGKVCFECGFEDVNHFIRAFRQSEGVTPGCFRKLLEN